MSQAIQKFLLNEERASTVVIESAVAIAVVGFIVAVAAIYFMK